MGEGRWAMEMYADPNLPGCSPELENEGGGCEKDPIESGIA